MKKKLLAMALALVMGCSAFGALAGCESLDDDPANVEDNGVDKIPQESIDKSKVQLQVFNYNGGFGSSWLLGVKQRFEEEYKDYSLNGKKGVQIVINPIKNDMNAMSIAMGDYDVYFTQNNYYDELITNKAVLDISEAVTTPNKFDVTDSATGAKKTLESKLSTEQRDFLNRGGKYYALPHYLAGSGLIYNVEVFEKHGLYFTDLSDDDQYLSGAQLKYNFIGGYPADQQSQLTKSKGPDGLAGTDDDGLPATYNEFYLLCDYMVQCGVTPLNWNGYRHYNYTTEFLNALAMQNEGPANARLNYSLNGTANDLVKDGEVPGPDGKFSASQLRSATIADDGTNSAKLTLQRQAGKYYAIDFLEHILRNYKTWANGNGFSTGYTHTQAQQDFIWGSKDPNVGKDIGMLIEGVWALNEGKTCFQDMVNNLGDQKYSINNRNFGWMPLPRANKDYVNADNVFVETLRALTLVSSKIAPEKKSLALDFIRFCHTDAELVKFTQSTNTMKGLNYKLTDSELQECSPFGRSLVKYIQADNTSVIYPYSKTKSYVYGGSRFRDIEMYPAKVEGTSYAQPSLFFEKYKNEKLTSGNAKALTYFNSLIA